MGFMWGFSAGVCGGAAVLSGQWWFVLLALIPFVGCIMSGENDVAADGKSVAWGIKD